MSSPYIDLETAHTFTYMARQNMAILSLRRDVETAFLIHLPGFFFYNFWHVTDELEKIRQRHWKEGLKISKLANLENFGK